MSETEEVVTPDSVIDVEGVSGESVASDLDILTADLQRLQAEYANYRKRVDRDRSVAHEMAVASVLTELLPILDDLDRARAHDELQGGFKSVADQLANVTAKLGLEQYGEVGTPFDPQIHEASCPIDADTAIEHRPNRAPAHRRDPRPRVAAERRGERDDHAAAADLPDGHSRRRAGDRRPGRGPC